MFKSFRLTLMLIILLFAVVPVALVAAMLSREIHELTTTSAYHELNLLAKGVAEGLDHELDLTATHALDIRANPDMVQATAPSPFGIKSSASYQAVEFMGQFLNDAPLVSGVYLLGPGAKVIEAMPAALTALAPDPIQANVETILAKTFDDDKPPCSLISFQGEKFLTRMQQEVTGQGQSVLPFASPHGLALLVPLIDAAGETRGALVAILPIARLAAHAAKLSGDTVSVDIVREGVDLLVRPTAQGKGSPAEKGEIASDAPFLQGRSFNLSGPEYRLRVAEPYAVRFAGVRETMYELGYLLLGSGLVLALFAYLIARRLVLPISSLGEIVRSYANGHYDAPTQTLLFTEFREVREVLAAMGQKIVAQLSALQQMNETLEEKVIQKTAELRDQYDQLKHANEKILQSIQYAEKIQHSLLPETPEMDRLLNNFVIWEPRDIVGGDLYLFEKCSHGYLVAIMDCTGHGVPGAFVTMIVGASFKTILKESAPDDPAALLSALNLHVKNALHQKGQGSLSSDDGLDAGICFVNQEKGTLTYAGARIPLWWSHNGEIQEIKGDKQSLGYIRSDPAFRFTNHELPLTSGAVYYLATDGLTDQIGGPARLPFGKKRLFEVLLNNRQLALAGQREMLLTTLEEYMASEERRDDLSVVGFMPVPE
jgi:serine phosphatase RsbU (regulator of sigma subunit)